MKVHVEHEKTDGEAVIDEFEGVESFQNPQMVSATILTFEDDEKDDKKLNYGTVVGGFQDTDD